MQDPYGAPVGGSSPSRLSLVRVMSDHSLGHSLLTPAQIAELADADGMAAVALCDRHTLAGHSEFAAACLARSLKPVFGVTLALAEDRFARGFETTHITLLAETKQGYANLRTILNRANAESFHFRPLVDLQLLSQHQEGVLVVEGGQTSQTVRLISQRRLREAEMWLRTLRVAFGDQLYVGLQDNGLPRAVEYNQHLMRMARGLQLPCVAAPEVGYVRAQDHQALEVVVAEQTGGAMLKLEGAYAWQEVGRGVSPELAAETERLLARCQALPDFESREQAEEDPEASVRLRARVESGLKSVYGSFPPDEAPARLEQELAVLAAHSTHLLLLADLCAWCHKQGILVGPGRGDAPASLVLYCLGLTQIDPLQAGLDAQRFLQATKRSGLDIDLDVPPSARDQVFDWLRERHGPDRCAGVSAFARRRSRAALSAVIRWTDLSDSLPESEHTLLAECDHAQRLVEALRVSTPTQRVSDASLAALVEASSRFRRMFKSAEGQRLLELAQLIEGRIVRRSLRVSALLMCERPVTESLEVARIQKTPAVAVSVAEAARAGTVQDVLGLRELGLLGRASQLIEESGPGLDVMRLPLWDYATLELLAQGPEGLFEFAPAPLRSALKDRPVDSFEPLPDLLTAYASGQLDRWQEGRAEDLPVGTLPGVNEVLAPTRGLLLYNEQLWEIGRLLDLSPEQIRKWESLFSADELLDMRSLLSEWTGISKDRLVPLMERIKRARPQLRSHRYAYAYVAWAQAYLMAHYPTEYVAALLDEGEREWTDTSQRLRVEVLPPSLAESEWQSRPEEGATRTVRLGLCAVRGMSQNAAMKLIALREQYGSQALLKEPHTMLPEVRKGFGRLSPQVQQWVLDQVKAVAA